MSKKRASDLELHDSEDDKKHLQPEEAILDLPDVEDIPGQENIKAPRFNELADTTASSADEEGDELFEDDDTPDAVSRVSRTEKKDLQRSASQTPGDESEEDVRESALDQTDDDGDPLNEGNLKTDRFGEDLDLPESEEVDEEDSEE